MLQLNTMIPHLQDLFLFPIQLFAFLCQLSRQLRQHNLKLLLLKVLFQDIRLHSASSFFLFDVLVHDGVLTTVELAVLILN